jgi:hypothetical protein
MRFVACLLIACAATMARGQQPGPSPTPANQAQPNPLDQLSFLKGDWSGKQNFNNQGGAAMVGDATDRIDVCIAGRYLCEMLSTTLPGRKPTDTRHFISYDKATGKYTAWWFNDTSTHPTGLTGDLNGSKLVLMSDPSSAGPVLRATYEASSADTLTFQLEMKAGDGWTKLFVSTYTKKAAAN